MRENCSTAQIPLSQMSSVNRTLTGGPAVSMEHFMAQVNLYCYISHIKANVSARLLKHLSLTCCRSYFSGSYFARDASYSNAYIRSQSSSKKIMFVVLVLVGEFTNGCHTYRRPPQKSTSKVLYDSCVDSENNPSIFVVFEKQQIYPEFVIEYSQNPRQCVASCFSENE